MERIDILEETARIAEIEYQLGILKRRLQRWLIEGDGEVLEEAVGLYDAVGVDGAVGDLEDITPAE